MREMISLFARRRIMAEQVLYCCRHYFQKRIMITGRKE